MNLRTKIIHTGLFILFLSTANINPCTAQSLSGEIKRAFQTEDAGMLSTHFGSRVTINIPGKETECGKGEAQEIIQAFFTDHAVRSFEIKFEGEKNNSNFLIGTLVTSSGTFRVNIFFKKSSNSNYIHLLRIEEDYGSSF